MSRALQAIVFDFDGVIANSEPLHLRAFQLALAEDGISLTPSEYYSRYLGFDDVGAFAAIARDRGTPMTDRRMTALVARKAAIMQEMMHGDSVLFPGARDFVTGAAAHMPIAIASGALRHEIEEIIAGAGVKDLFSVIVAAGDTPEGKP
jgi:beta-phosphoglucomutase